MSVFENLVGQEHVVEIIKGAVAATRSGAESQEMTHAWVFTGPPGSGRSSAAVAFAQALVCPKDGCGDCNLRNHLLDTPTLAQKQRLQMIYLILVGQ